MVLALSNLEGAHRAVDTEDVAVEAYRISGATFAWRKYEDQINLELVRVSLSDAKKEKLGRLVSGSGIRGWRLTEAGYKYAKALHTYSPGSEINAKPRSAGSVDSRRSDRERARLLNSRAFCEWSSGEQASLDDIHDLFRIDTYTPSEMVETKIVRLRSLISDEMLDSFLDYCVNKLKREPY